MTRISSYQLLQCSTCGQKHILPNYASINFALGYVPELPKAKDLMVCQRCSAQKPLNHFISLGSISKPDRDDTPNWFKPIRRRLDKNYKEPELHPMQLYPDLGSTPFDPETYYDDLIKEFKDKNNAYPKWFKELSSLR